ncbi:MAG: acyltransferase family protein [Hyphomicrobiales bacterium]
MTTATTLKAALPAGDKGRVDWVDYAKGFCIIFVVMMHSTLGVGKAAGEEGWLHYLVEYARPFRMPDFFMIAGLFLALVIDRPWKSYLDKKVIHFVYFYLIWTFIQFGIKIPVNGAEYGYGALPFLYLETLWEPYATLWFIYMLPIMFVITKLLKFLPWYVVFAGAALLQIAPIHTGNLIVDEFASRYVYFFAGYFFAPHIFKLAEWTRNNVGLGMLGLAIWALFNGVLMFNSVSVEFGSETTVMKYGDLPLVSLLLGFAGAVGVILVSALLAKVKWMSFLRYCGQHSIVVYLAFFFPMAISRAILLKLGIISDIGTISMIVTATAVIAPLVLYWIIQKIGFGYFLFVRPAWAHLDGAKPTNKKVSLTPTA